MISGGFRASGRAQTDLLVNDHSHIPPPGAHPYSGDLRPDGNRAVFPDEFDRQALACWFGLDTQPILYHLARLDSLPQAREQSLRLDLLSRLTSPAAVEDDFEILYRRCLTAGDPAAAVAAAGAAIDVIFKSGRDFNRFEQWSDRIDHLLRHPGLNRPETGDSLPRLARANLFGARGLVELTGIGDLNQATASYEAAQACAEEAESFTLRVFYAVLSGFCYFWGGDTTRLELILSDTAPLTQRPETSLAARLFFQLLSGLSRFLNGDADGTRLLRDAVNHPAFDHLPPLVWFLGQINLMLVTSLIGETEEMEVVSRRIQERAVPDRNHFFNAFVHYNKGNAYRVIGRPYKALVHGRNALDRAAKGQSFLTQQFSALLIGQALSDLNERKEALSHLLGWLGKWKAAGLNLLAAAGSFQIAYLLLRRGDLEEARRFHDQASEWITSEHPLASPLKCTEFGERLRRLLHPRSVETEEWLNSTEMPVCIETFGTLRVHIQGRTVYDRRWRGGRTKTLLKALIAHGGAKVPVDHLLDILWPDAEGDRAMKNLKTALSRLRRVGLLKGEKPTRWIVVRHGRVSLVKNLCSVDVLRFRERLAEAVASDGDIARLSTILDGYTGDVLAHDVGEPWITQFREVVRGEYVQGVLTLADRCLNAGQPARSLPYLKNALEKDPLHEEVYAALIRLHLAMGFPSNALRTYARAEAVLLEELGIRPGPTLRKLAQSAGIREN